MEGRIVRTFDGDILTLRLRALELGGLAIDQVQRAVQALLRDDEAAAGEVIERTAQLTASARTLDEEIVGLIARRQPVAYDLRAILTIGRVGGDLERAGGAARKIARRALELHESTNALPPRFYHDVRKMSRLALAMLRDALDCFDRVDLEGAEAVQQRDRDLDAEFQLALRELVTYVMEDPRCLANTVQTIFVIKALERVGDHARNIASLVQRLVHREEHAPPAQAAGV